MYINPSNQKTFPQFLRISKESLFDSLGLEIHNIQLEPESAEYDACYFQIQKKNIRFRKAKITSKKVGQFVTLWKRSKDGLIEPFKSKDDIDIFIIATPNKNRVGHFIFTKQVLDEKGILSGKHEGKRGFRVYPAWDTPDNKQGLTTQKWQLPYFVESNKNLNGMDVIGKLLDIKIKLHS